MDTEKRLFLALSLSMLIVIAFSWMNAGQIQQQQIANQYNTPYNDSPLNTALDPTPEQAGQLTADQVSAGTAVPEGPWSWLTSSEQPEPSTIEPVIIQSELYQISFSPQGAIPTSWKLLQFEELFSDPRYLNLKMKHGTPYEQAKAHLELQLLESHDQGQYYVDAIDPFFPEGDAGLTIKWGNGLDDQNLIYHTDSNQVTITEPTDVEFRSSQGPVTLVKRFRFYPDSYRVDLSVSIENNSENEIRFLDRGFYDVNWMGGFGFPSFRWDAINNTHLQIEGTVNTLNVDGLRNEIQRQGVLSSFYEVPRIPVTEAPVGWVSVGQKYFLSAIVPQSLTHYAFKGISSSQTVSDSILKPNVGVRLSVNSILPGKSHTDNFTLYVGPIDEANLAKAEAGLEDANVMFLKRVVGPIAQLMLSLLQGLHTVVPNYGVAIILLTLLVKLVMLPIYQKQMKSMKKMQALQPHLNSLREQYKDDPQKMQKEQMELFRRHKVNPLAGCLPILITIPIFIALYATFNMAVELRGAPFVGWINDLSSPDRAFFIPIGSWIFSVNILPLMYSVLMFWNMSQNKIEGPNAAVMKIMPIMFVFFFWTIASGVILYFVISMSIDVVQRKILDKFHKDEPLPEVPEPPKKGNKKSSKKKKAAQ